MSIKCRKIAHKLLRLKKALKKSFTPLKKIVCQKSAKNNKHKARKLKEKRLRICINLVENQSAQENCKKKCGCLIFRKLKGKISQKPDYVERNRKKVFFTSLKKLIFLKSAKKKLKKNSQN